MRVSPNSCAEPFLSSGGAYSPPIWPSPINGETEFSGRYPVFVIVTDDENGKSGSAGSDIVAVTRGKKVTTAPGTPSSVANPKIAPIIDIRGFFFSAAFGLFCALPDSRALPDIGTSQEYRPSL